MQVDGSVLGGRALESGADETAPGAVASVSPERGLEGVCIDPRCPSRPARVDVLAGAAAEPTVLATVFALRPWPEVGDHGFRVRWANFDPARVRHMAARDPQGRIRVESGGRGLPSQADLPTLAELVSLVALAAELADPLQGPDLAAEYGVVRLSGLFDDAWYLERHPDVAAAGMDPLLHYLVAGEAEGRAASFYFDAAHYRATAGVSAAGSVLAHYVQGGFRERPATSIHFDGACYAEHYRLAPEQDALADFLAQRRLRNPNRLFDVVRYLGRYPDLAGLDDPYRHFAEWGAREGRQASDAFHAKFYAQTYLGDEEGANPFLHYLSTGRFQGFLPAPRVDAVSAAAEIRAFTQPGPYFEEEPRQVLAGASPVKTFAFYLPQFHPIAENDAFWGTGFTEWRNLARGQPRFAGHYQPRTPRDLGFYDLLDTANIRRQVQTAERAGIFGFCHYFYWFNGRRVLEKPLDLFVEDESLSMPFCLMWANENWTRRWDGQEQDVLLRQDYDPAHDEALFDCLAGYFASPRYYRVGGRPLLFIYRPGIIPDARAYFDRIRAGVKARLGVEPLLFMAQAFGDEDPRPFGLDGALEFPPHKVTARGRDVAKRQQVLDWSFTGQVFDYDEIAAIALADTPRDFPLIKTVLPMWDNDARKQGHGLCIHGSTPEKFARWFGQTCAMAREHPVESEPLVFVNAWNEWCEGTYLEPDVHYGWAYLNAIAAVLSKEEAGAGEGRRKILLVGHDAFPAGAQYLLLNIGRQLKEFGFEVTFYLLAGGELVDAYRAVAPVLLGSEEAPGSAIPRLRARGYRHALTNTSAAGGIVPSLKAAGLTVASLVHELPSLIRSYGLEEACRAIADGSDHAIFASSYVADRFYDLTKTGTERALIREQGLYNDPAGAADAAGLREELGIPTDARIVLGVGYGDLRKGVDVFATFARQARAEGGASPLHFVWVGGLDPAVATWIGADRARPGAENLHFAGHRTDVARFYGLADLVFLPSREDPYPTVVLEALASGLPVIGFADCGGFTDLLTDPSLGRLCPFGEYGAFRDALAALLPTGRDGEARAARQDFVRSHFDWATYCFDLARILMPELRSVSVVVPNFNYARFLEERLATIFGQTYPVREVIVLDDASADDSLAAIERASEAAGRTVELLARKRNSGNVFRQWKRGLDEARGEYLWIAEADDASDPAFLERLVDALGSLDRPGFAFCDSRAIDEAGATVYESYKGYYAADGDHGLDGDGRFDARSFLGRFLTARNLVLNVSAVLWRSDHLREVFARLGSDAFAFRCAGDWRVYVESCRAGGEVAYVAEPLNRHRRHGSSVTHALAKGAHLDEICRVQALALSAGAPDPAVAARVARFQDELHASWGLASASETARAPEPPEPPRALAA